MSRKSKYTKEFKLKAVKRVLNDHQSVHRVSDDLGIHKSDLHKWVAYYQKYGISGLRSIKTNTRYSGDFKLEVVRSIEQKGLSFRQASLKYNIPTHSTVQSWYQLYEEKGVCELYEDGRGRYKSMNKSKPKRTTNKPLTKEEELLLENESLKAELALLKKLQALAQVKKKKQ